MTRLLTRLTFALLALAGAGSLQASQDHWAFQTVKRPAVPAIESGWPQGDIDRFVLAKLREKGMQPATRTIRMCHGLPNKASWITL